LQAGRESAEAGLGVVQQLKARQPVPSGGALRFREGLKESDSLVEAGAHCFEAARRIHEVEMQLRRDPADAPLEFPDRFTRPAPQAEHDDMVLIDLRIIAQDEAQESCFAGTIRTEQGPAFAGTDGPVDLA